MIVQRISWYTDRHVEQFNFMTSDDRMFCGSGLNREGCGRKRPWRNLVWFAGIDRGGGGGWRIGGQKAVK